MTCYVPTLKKSKSVFSLVSKERKKKMLLTAYNSFCDPVDTFSKTRQKGVSQRLFRTSKNPGNNLSPHPLSY